MRHIQHPRVLVAMALALAGFGVAPLAARQTHAHAGNGAAPHQATVPLYDDLGDHAYPVSTTEPLAQRYFDQGLRLYYAFNHQEAIRSFREAQRIDPDCTMCFWGEALAWGPNINLPMDAAAGAAAYAAVQRAASLASDAPERERALVRALELRYAADPASPRPPLDSAYAEAMTRLASLHPGDAEIAVLAGEARMDLRPWDYWASETALEPGVAAAVRAFERVLAANPDHPGACHFFIHAVEERRPERAVPCAERLAGLMPGAGHIVHMPGHIYIRVGRYLDAVEANRHAVHADESWIQDQNPAAGIYTAGYYPHNYDFLAFAASMIGRSEEAIRAADQVARLIPTELLHAPGMALLQNWLTRPLQVRVRFGRWDEILAAPRPGPGLPHARAMWSYARGRALAATGDVAAARAELAELRDALAGPELKSVRMEFNASLEILGVAERVLTGWIHAAEGSPDLAVVALEEAVRLEDALLYGEPPEWTVPVRHDLGEALLAAGQPASAERVFRESLARFPANGWSLSGLARALRAQPGRGDEADDVERELARVWEGADVPLPGGS